MKNRAISSEHQPHCESATPDMLSSLVASRFPADSDGITRIPYTLFGQRRFHIRSFMHELATREFSSLAMPSDDANFMTKIMTDALAAWTKISNNKVIFYQQDNFLDARGIRFNLATNRELGHHNALALVQWSFDNDGYLQVSDVYFPADKTFWKALKKGNDYNLMTIHHEISHALGVSRDWPEDAPAMLALKSTYEGMLCSVMPYHSRIESETSICHESCNPRFAISPGPTDVVMFKMAYENRNFPKICFYPNIDSSNVAANVLSNLPIIAMANVSSSFLVGFGTNLAFTKPNVPSIPAKAVHLVADTAMLGALIGIGMPALECGVFAITAATKYAPEWMLQKLAEHPRLVLTSSYSFYALGLIMAVRKGYCLLPLVATATVDTVVTFASRGVGGVLGNLAGMGTSYVVRKLRFSISEPPAAVETDIEVAQQSEKPSRPHWWSRLFCCRRPRNNGETVLDHNDLAHNNKYV